MIIIFSSLNIIIKNVRSLNESGIPYLIIHLPISDEIASNKKAELSVRNRQKQWNSIERVTGKKIQTIFDYLGEIPKNPFLMDSSKTNKHPSPWGMNLYSDTIIKILVSNKLINF